MIFYLVVLVRHILLGFQAFLACLSVHRFRVRQEVQLDQAVPLLLAIPVDQLGTRCKSRILQ